MAENGGSTDGAKQAMEVDGQQYDEDGHIRRTGNVWTATAHVVTAVIGSGVLSLSWSIAQIGWVFGPLILAMFSAITLYTSYMLADAYRSMDPVTGKRNHNYMEAVKNILGGWQVYACGLVQHVNLVGTAIGYTVTSAISMVAVKRAGCFHANPNNLCHVSNNPYMLIFGGIQLLFSQVPDFDRIWFMSIVAAVMSFTYSTIGLGLSIGKATEDTHPTGTWDGVRLSTAFKVWAVFQSLGNMAFAYSFSFILIEVQDTIRGPPSGPPERDTMKRATTYGIVITTFFYMAIGVIGYAGFGNPAAGNLLTGFGFYNPFWLLDIALLCVVIHLVGAYQVFAQPFFAFFEESMLGFFPNSALLRKTWFIPIPRYGLLPLSPFRLVWRSVFVVFTTLVAMILPFFNDILGLLGALGFWPLTVYFPIEMHIKQHNIPAFSPKWLWLEGLSFFCFLVSLVSGIGSVEGVVQDLKHYKIFHTSY